jgi:hypothetical protein
MLRVTRQKPGILRRKHCDINGKPMFEHVVERKSCKVTRAKKKPQMNEE